MVALHEAQIDFSKETVTYTPVKTRRRNKTITVPIHPRLLVALAELPTTKGYYFQPGPVDPAEERYP